MIVYKYRDWSNQYHRCMLTQNQVYLSSPKDLNDPFDCRVRPKYVFQSEEDLDKYVEDVMNNQEPRIRREGLDKTQVKNDFKKRLINTEFQKDADTMIFSDQDMFIGVFSLSKEWNSIPMWSYYSSNHTGYCIGFHERILGECGHLGGRAYVEYLFDYPIIEPRAAKDEKQLQFESILKKYFKKSKDWQHEEEYRMFRQFYPNKPTSKDRAVTIPDNAFAEVMLGINISDCSKKEIVEICNGKGIPVYQCKPVPFKFKIQRERID